jgi:hypothetical protein
MTKGDLLPELRQWEECQPTSLSLSTPGIQLFKIKSPFGVECEVAISHISMTTNDAACFVVVDQQATLIPSNGVTNGFVLGGIVNYTPETYWCECKEFVTAVVMVGATNSTVNLILQWRRRSQVYVPQQHQTDAFTQ